MRSYASKIGLVLIVLFCTSCFEIHEILNLRKDGTGTYQMIVDMSQSRAMLSMLESLGESDSVETEKKSPFEEIDESFLETKASLEEIEGIINVEAINDEENLKFGVQFEFLNSYALNKALNRINADKEATEMVKEKVYFSFSKKTFERYNTENFAEDIMKGAGMGEEGDSLNIAMFFKDLSYSTEYTMPKKIKSMTNPDAVLSDDKRTVSVTYFPFRGEGEINFSNKIKY